MSDDSTFTIEEVVLIAKTDKAILVRGDDVEEEDAVVDLNQWWIPLKEVEWTDLNEVGDEGSVEIPTWLARKKELL